MALLAWWSAPEAKLITNNEKINELSHFVQMLQTVPVSSNFEVIIMFPGQNFIQIVIHGDNVRYDENSLIQLVYIYILFRIRSK